MKTLSKKFFYAAAILIALAVSVCFTGCTSQITLELKKDGSIDIAFSGSAGKAFAAMIRSASGMSAAENSDSSAGVIFDTDEIEYELAKNGFTNVKAVSKTGTDLSITMTDRNRKSALFKSEVVSVEKGKLTASLTPQKLVKFYNNSDSQTTMFLDMLLSPVFNDEKMSEEEYLEVLASFYGQEIADEIKDAEFRIELINPDGTKTVHTIGIAKLLCLDEVIYLR